MTLHGKTASMSKVQLVITHSLKFDKSQFETYVQRSYISRGQEMDTSVPSESNNLKLKLTQT